jgi:N,N'-diacetyllegionaminate synthase
MRVLALVTARGGSKGFPGKNLALLAGRPLVTWAHRVLAEFRAQHPSHEIVVRLSTDSPAIAAAWPPSDRPSHLRPAELSGDEASSFAVVEYELDQMAALGRPCDAVLLYQPTSPLINCHDVDNLWQVINSGAKAAIGVVKVQHPVQWAFAREETGLLSPLNGDHSTRRRQELPQGWMPTGIYFIRVETFRSQRGFAPHGITIGVEIPLERAIDIDLPADLDNATAALQCSHVERPFSIGKRSIGGSSPCFVIAEAGVNHNGNVDMALDLIRAAATTGADAVKFQTFTTSELVTHDAQKCAYQVTNTGSDDGQASMLRRLELGADIFAQLKAEAERLNLAFLSTPFDWPSTLLLHNLGIDAFKLGSGELTNLPFLGRIAELGRPLIISTGMSTLDECENAAACIRSHGNPPVAWLHCVSCYPAPHNQSNLRAMDSLRVALGGPIGMSDHSTGAEISVAAVARGAQIIEKHLTLDRTLPGPDHAASVEPKELADLIRQVRLVEAALGDGIKKPAPCEENTAAAVRRSLVAVRALAIGHVLTESDLVIKRPGTGILPAALSQVVGRQLKRGIAVDQLLSWDDLT